MNETREGLRRPDSETRCPYCHDALDAGVAVECAGCGTPHHPGCFGEHGACTVHGCPSRAASAPSNAPAQGVAAMALAAAAYGAQAPSAEGTSWIRRAFAGTLRCDACQRACDGPLVARERCLRALHPECYEARGACACEVCRVLGGAAVIVAPAEARRLNRDHAARSITNMGLLFGLPSLAVLILALLAAPEVGTIVLATALVTVSGASVALGALLRIGARSPPAGPARGASNAPGKPDKG